METRNADLADLEKALMAINQKYHENIEFRRLDPTGRNWNFTLRVKDSKGPGHRRGFSGRRTIDACWHVHGNFFDALIAVNPEARVISRGIGVTIDKNGGNWKDKNIGSMVQPFYYSDACDCGEVR